jgi:hypothetical protein
MNKLNQQPPTLPGVRNTALWTTPNLRVGDSVQACFTGRGLLVLWTFAGDAEALAAWLDTEAERRQPS